MKINYFRFGLVSVADKYKKMFTIWPDYVTWINLIIFKNNTEFHDYQQEVKKVQKSMENEIRKK